MCFIFKEAVLDFPICQTPSHWGVNEEAPSICVAPCTVRADAQKQILSGHTDSRALAIPFQPPPGTCGMSHAFRKRQGHVGSVLCCRLARNSSFITKKYLEQ